MPLVDNIHAEFHGDKVKLEWVVSLDGKKIQSETYKVLAILDNRKSEQPEQKAAIAPSRLHQPPHRHRIYSCGLMNPLQPQECHFSKLL
jgi:hypothetical protein